jgi:hypothetical protein
MSLTIKQLNRAIAKEQKPRAKDSVRYLDLELPRDDSVTTRIEWAGERIADLSEGLLSMDLGWFVWNIIVGWSDLATTDEKRQYLAVSRLVAELLRGMEGH